MSMCITFFVFKIWYNKLMESQPNFHEISKERKVLRKALNETPKSIKPAVEKEINPLNEKAGEFSIEKIGGLSKAKERLKKDKKEAEENEKNRWIDEEAIKTELGQTYIEISELSKKLKETGDFEMSLLLRRKNNPYTDSLDIVINAAKKEKSNLEHQLSHLSETSPTAMRATELVEYKKGLHKEGHIAETPSVKEYLGEIGQRMIAGKPMFLHGPTGTGKTSLARKSAESLMGTKPYMVYCNPQTRESNIWGKTGIKPTEGGGIQTVDIYGPLAKAMQEGKVVIFDEFTALPREQMVFIKGIFNAKPGDTVSIVGNGETKIAPGFQMIFTANLKSEKNPERAELPPEIAREFEQNNLEINYTPKEEAYDIMLARLMDKDGSVNLSYHDLNITLPKFCEAMSEVQTAYTGELNTEMTQITQTAGVSGKPPSLKKLVFTQGTVENIIDAWNIEQQTKRSQQTFVEFLDQRLKTALTFKEYPEADRILTAKILASKGFLRTLTEKDLSLPSNTLNFDVARKMRGEEAKTELITDSSKTRHLSIKEVAELDPFKLRQRKAIERAEEFLPEEEETKPENQPAQSYEQFFKETMKNSWNWKDEVIAKFIDTPISQDPRTLPWQVKEKDIDADKLGEYTINPDTANIDWSTISPDKIKVFNLENMQGKKLSEVAEYIISNFPSSKYKIPGIEYWKYILENPDKAPTQLKDGKYHFFFGSILRGGRGHFDVPYASWDGSSFDRDGSWLGSSCYSDYCLVLLEI